jgi:hypothetical protein
MKAVYLFLLLHFNLHLLSQNIGIGTIIPLAQLHVKADEPEVLRLESPLPYLSFYRGPDYKGYLWYNGGAMQLGTATNEPVIISANYTSSPAYFTSNGRLGLGIFNPSEKLDVNGNINLNGSIKVNGNPGTAGQVLTSNGVSPPNWTSVTSSNNIRFSVQFDEGPGFPSDYALISATNYNLNPAEVVIGGNTITFNRSGLYHFDMGVNASITYSASTTTVPIYFMAIEYGLGVPRNLTSGSMISRTASNTFWSGANNISFDLYLSAPVTVRFLNGLSGPSFVSRDLSGFIFGHLISE